MARTVRKSKEDFREYHLLNFIKNLLFKLQKLKYSLNSNSYILSNILQVTSTLAALWFSHFTNFCVSHKFLINAHLKFRLFYRDALGTTPLHRRRGNYWHARGHPYRLPLCQTYPPRCRFRAMVHHSRMSRSRDKLRRFPPIWRHVVVASLSLSLSLSLATRSK